MHTLHTNSENEQVTMKLFKIITHLLPFMLVYVCNSDAVCREIEDDTKDINPDIINSCSKMNNPLIFYKGAHNIGAMIDKFEWYISKTENAMWPELKWFLEL